MTIIKIESNQANVPQIVKSAIWTEIKRLDIGLSRTEKEIRRFIKARKRITTVVLAILNRVCNLFAVLALTSPFGIFFLPEAGKGGLR